MRKRQVTILLSLLIGFFLYCDVALCLLGLDLDFFGLAYYPPFFQIGVLTAQVALLATWAAFGTEAIYVRLPRTVFLTCLVCLASAWGLKSNQGGIVGGEVWLLLVILCQFPVALIVLMLLRKFRDWRLVAPSTTIDPREDKKRFSLSRLFIWQTQAALVLLFFALFIRESIFNEFLSLQTVLLYVLLITVLVSIALSFPLAFAINLAIGTNRRRSSAFALLLSIGFAIGLFALLLYFVEGSLPSSNEIRREIVMFLVHYFTVFAVLLFIRSIGIRLIRVPTGDPKEPITVPILSEQQANRRFTISVAAILLTTLLTIPLALKVQRARAEAAKSINLAQLGMYSSSGEHADISQISFESGKPVREAALAKLSEYPDLMWLIFTGAQVTDEQLERVAKFKNLERLYLDDTDITDSGLEHLKGMTHLSELHLTGSKVTAEGVQQLQQDLPNCMIFYPFPIELAEP